MSGVKDKFIPTESSVLIQAALHKVYLDYQSKAYHEAKR